jgi:hypothetical protein
MVSPHLPCSVPSAPFSDSLSYSLTLRLSPAPSQFSIAAINESDTVGQWEPLAPTKEAQAGILFSFLPPVSL